MDGIDSSQPSPLSGDADFDQFRLLNELAASGEILIDGINLFDVIRNDLGLMLARGHRHHADPARFAPEATVNLAAVHEKNAWQIAGEDMKGLPGALRARYQLRSWDGPRIFLQQSTKLVRVAQRLAGTAGVLPLSNKRGFAPGTLWAPVATLPGLIAGRRGAPALAARVRQALQDRTVSLYGPDLTALEAIVGNALFGIRRALRQLDAYRPDLVVVGGDNFLPPVALVLAARARGTPTLCVQHGLDCERYFHEQVYSDVFCAWGAARAERCRRHSTHQPREILVTGCPEFDSLRLQQAPWRAMDDWLWLTRPHEPLKCCEPSRYTDEGTRIFAVLLEALRESGARQLQVKAHPRDDTRPYRLLAARMGLADRVSFIEGRGRVAECIARADLVFSEDSTSGMEAMFQGKPVIHTHFSAAPPSLPFVEYGAALGGYGAQMIRESLGRMRSAGPELSSALLAGQRRFIEDHAGVLDGGAGTRVDRIIPSAMQHGPESRPGDPGWRCG